MPEDLARELQYILQDLFYYKNLHEKLHDTNVAYGSVWHTVNDKIGTIRAEGISQFTETEFEPVRELIG